MTCIYTPLRTESIDNRSWDRLTHIFDFESDVLKKYGLKSRIQGPVGFVQDFESMPLFKGSNKRAGTIHDILSRKGVCLGITKAIAAEVYREFIKYCNDIDTNRFRKIDHPWIPDPVVVPVIMFRDWAKRWVKWSVVRVWPGYWQRFELMATAEEIMGIKEDPYITAEKLDNLIDQTKTMTSDIKDLPPESQGDMVEKVEAVTTELKEEKAGLD